MTATDIFQPTSDELELTHQALKSTLLGRIEAYFRFTPGPVRKADPSDAEINLLPLLEYPVVTGEHSESFVTELRAEGFAFETPYDEGGQESYSILPVEALLDVVRVLERCEAEKTLLRRECKAA